MLKHAKMSRKKIAFRLRNEWALLPLFRYCDEYFKSNMVRDKQHIA